MKNVKKIKGAAVPASFYKTILIMMFLFALILPLLMKVLLDVPVSVADYLCNSYAGIYPEATTAGLILSQILLVITELLRAGFIGCVLSILLYLIGRKAETKRICICLATALISPLAVSAVGMGLNYFCVSVGISRDSLTLFRLKLPQLLVAAMIEYLLYVVLMVCATLILYRFAKKYPKTLFEDTGGFFPGSALFRAVTVSISLFGLISLIMTVSDTILDLRTYADITSDFAGIMGYLVLPYLYLIFKLVSMLFFSSLLVRRLDRRWNECGGDGK